MASPTPATEVNMKKKKRAVTATPEDRILEVLKQRKAGASLDELLESLGGEGYKQQMFIKAAIWRLIADSVVEMTADQKLRVHA